MTHAERDPHNNYDPYPFTESDLQIDTLNSGTRYTLEQFYRWRDNNPGLIAEYIENCREQLVNTKSEHNRSTRFRRAVSPASRHNFEQMQAERELSVFGIRNMAEIPDADKLTRFGNLTLLHTKKLEKTIRQIQKKPQKKEQMLSILHDKPETEIIEERWRRLYQILPEQVIRNGAMGKIARTMLGVGVIAAYDFLDQTPEVQKAHMVHVLRGAYIYGAAYAIVDDTLQDMQGNFISKKDREIYHEVILEGLRTGNPFNMDRLPDHPLSEEINILYEMFKKHYPKDMHPNLYKAAEALYAAQYRDMQLRPEDNGTIGLRDIYPGVMIKSAMTRVIANLLARKRVDADFYRRCINSMIVHQLRDDCVDFLEDKQAVRVTTFTHPRQQDGMNPLYDMFAYDAYIGQTIYPGALSTLAYSQVVFLSHYLSSRPNQSEELLRTYGDTIPSGLRQFIRDATRNSPTIIYQNTMVDQKLKSAVNDAVTSRDQTTVDPQTFILDRIDTINTLMQQFIRNHKKEYSGYGLNTIMQYALEAGGKRIRPALTLMLAESLDVDPNTITPLLLASELFHSSSLLLDDLPWQDNSTTRRGKPTAHTVFPASTVELTGIYMLLEGISILQELNKYYPPEDIIALTSYTTSVIQDICLGQNMDLHMKKEDTSLENILLMYHLKTAVAIEASLVPLMMLQKRSPVEIEYIQKYAHHAGLVFQMKDDLLDALSNTGDLGKDVLHDANKLNLVQLYGQDKTAILMEYHLKQAIDACQQLPFNTNLLQGIVTYFAKRKR